MIFRPDLAEKVMRGEKTVTRRVCSENPRSPWFKDRCKLVVGADYAVCPGRGKNAIGRVIVRRVWKERLYLAFTNKEARLEGFATGLELRRAFAAINGELAAHTFVWRIEFEVFA